MRLRICAVGRLKQGPERALFDDYLSRFDRMGRTLGFGPVQVSEIDERKGGSPAREAPYLRKATERAERLCVLDERGQQLTSPQFADLLAKWRDEGRAEAAFLIGGADGLDPELVAQADARLSFGRMVWPHMLARVMLAEQLYRAATILAGAPYHRA